MASVPPTISQNTKFSLGILVSAVAFTWIAAGIYEKMPSALQVEKIDAAHTVTEAAMRKEITSNKEGIAGIRGQVGFLVRIETARAAGNPAAIRAIQKAAREVRMANNTDPLDGIEMEQD